MTTALFKWLLWFGVNLVTLFTDAMARFDRFVCGYSPAFLQHTEVHRGVNEGDEVVTVTKHDRSTAVTMLLCWLWSPLRRINFADASSSKIMDVLRVFDADKDETFTVIRSPHSCDALNASDCCRMYHEKCHAVPVIVTVNGVAATDLFGKLVVVKGSEITADELVSALSATNLLEDVRAAMRDDNKIWMYQPATSLSWTFTGRDKVLLHAPSSKNTPRPVKTRPVQ